MSGVRVPRIRILALAVAAVLALAACGGGSDGADAPSTGPSPSGPRPSSPAQLTIVSPRNGRTVAGPDVMLRVDLEGARIVPATTTDISPDEGHLHVILDDQLISMTEGLRQTIPDVSPGPHRIMVEFVASDHAPFDPRVVAIVAFQVAS